METNNSLIVPYIKSSEQIKELDEKHIFSNWTNEQKKQSPNIKETVLENL